MLIHADCRSYRGSLPCIPNKARGKECPECDEYDPIRQRILIIKLGAPGDVLRTTALLPGIHRKWPGCEVTWLTRKSAASLLENLEQIDRILVVEDEGALQARGEQFDICANLDNEPLAAALATQQRAVRHLGYILEENGRVIAANQEARPWLEMACFDRIKRQNQLTYQAHMRSILGIPPEPSDPVQVHLSPSEVEAAREHLRSLGMAGFHPIAFNTGAGERWKTKLWPMERFLELGLLLGPMTSKRILLLGGPCEEEANRILALERPDLFISAGVLPIRVFLALVSECALMVTSDTLALHAGLGTGVRTVALFGPTSAVEIEPSGPLLKIVSPKPCVSYYARECNEKPCCMEEITADMVFEQIRSLGWLGNLSGVTLTTRSSPLSSP